MLKVYQCEKCGKTMVVDKELKELQGWKEVVAGVTDAAQEKHVPVVSTRCGKVTINVGSVAHPMTAEHLIEWVAIETTRGYAVIALKAEQSPVVTYKLNDDEKLVAVYAYCNLHGLWKN